jgi:hypothetical protein
LFMLAGTSNALATDWSTSYPPKGSCWLQNKGNASAFCAADVNFTYDAPDTRVSSLVVQADTFVGCGGHSSRAFTAFVGDVNATPDGHFSYHGPWTYLGGTRGTLDLEAHILSDGTAAGSFTAKGTFTWVNPGVDVCTAPFEIQRSFVSQERLVFGGRPIANADVIGLSKTHKPVAINVLRNDRDPGGKQLKVKKLVRGVKCGKLTLKNGMARFKDPEKGCAKRQRGIYTATNGKLVSNKASIFVNPTRITRQKKKQCETSRVDSGARSFNPYIPAEEVGYTPFTEVLVAKASDRCGHGNLTGTVTVGAIALNAKRAIVSQMSAEYRTSKSSKWVPWYVRLKNSLLDPSNPPNTYRFDIGVPHAHLDLAKGERITAIHLRTVVVGGPEYKTLGAPASNIYCSFKTTSCHE